MRFVPFFRVRDLFISKSFSLSLTQHTLYAGIITALNYEVGQDMVENRQFSKREDFFQTVFEIARRHKIMNPEKMRTSYCKLMYMLQDARSEKIRSLLEFDVFCPLTTVYSVLKSAGAESLLSDPLMAVATMECPDDKSKTRYQLNERIRTKQKAIRKLSRKYSTSQLDQDDIEQMLYVVFEREAREFQLLFILYFNCFSYFNYIPQITRISIDLYLPKSLENERSNAYS